MTGFQVLFLWKPLNLCPVAPFLHLCPHSFELCFISIVGELNGFVASLISNDYDTSRRNMDMTAMGYIITSLQLLIGLDDTTEKELSSIATEMNELFAGSKSVSLVNTCCCLFLLCLQNYWIFRFYTPAH